MNLWLSLTEISHAGAAAARFTRSSPRDPTGDTRTAWARDTGRCRRGDCHALSRARDLHPARAGSPAELRAHPAGESAASVAYRADQLGWRRVLRAMREIG